MQIDINQRASLRRESTGVDTKRLAELQEALVVS